MLARETPSAAQAAAFRPLAGARATTASIRALRRSPLGGAPGVRQLFLKFDDGLGALQALLQPGVVPPGAGQLGGQWVGRRRFGTPLARGQRPKGAGIALSPPIGKGR